VQKTFLEIDENMTNVKLHKGESWKQYKFSHIYEKVNNEKFFDVTIKPSLPKVFNGENIAIFAYGITASGKTHTIVGNNKDPGIIPRTLRIILQIISKLNDQNININNHINKNNQYSAAISFLEVYNDLVYDLFRFSKNQNTNISSTTSLNQAPEPLKIRVTETDAYIPDATVQIISTEEVIILFTYIFQYILYYQICLLYD
jgi:hypothetical protein